jgi:hypothetical protein
VITMGRRKNLPQLGLELRPVIHPVVSRYTDCAIPVSQKLFQGLERAQFCQNFPRLRPPILCVKVKTLERLEAVA